MSPLICISEDTYAVIISLPNLHIHIHTYIHTYIHNWSLQTFYQDYGLVSHTTYVGCVCVLILNMSSGTCSVKSTPNDRFLRNSFIADLFTHGVNTRNLLRGSHRRISQLDGNKSGYCRADEFSRTSSQNYIVSYRKSADTPTELA